MLNPIKMDYSKPYISAPFTMLTINVIPFAMELLSYFQIKFSANCCKAHSVWKPFKTSHIVQQDAKTQLGYTFLGHLTEH